MPARQLALRHVHSSLCSLTGLHTRSHATALRLAARLHHSGATPASRTMTLRSAQPRRPATVTDKPGPTRTTLLLATAGPKSDACAPAAAPGPFQPSQPGASLKGNAAAWPAAAGPPGLPGLLARPGAALLRRWRGASLAWRVPQDLRGAVNALQQALAPSPLAPEPERALGQPQQQQRRAYSGEAPGAAQRAAGAGEYQQQSEGPPSIPVTSATAALLREAAKGAAEVTDAGEATAAGTAARSLLAERLAFKPRLAPWQVAVCLLLPAAVCAAIYAPTAPASLAPGYIVCMALLYALGLAACRMFLLERQYSGRLLTERELAEPDSLFRTVDGVAVHYKRTWDATGGAAAVAAQAAPLAIHCYHGFGANTFSWSLVAGRLAARCRALVACHDMPGFGLTQRPRHAAAYCLGFNGRLGRTILDAELAEGGIIAAPDAQQGSQPEQQAEPRVRRVLMGHSMGAACAAAEAIANPQGLHALVLVAPAIFAFKWPSGGRPAAPAPAGQDAADPGGLAAASAVAAAASAAPAADPPPARGSSRAATALRVAGALAQVAALALARAVLLALRPVLVLALRGAVRSRAFWERGLSNAWHARGGVSPAIVDAYRSPQLVRGWERGLLAFVAARVAGTETLWARVRAAAAGTSAAASQADQLAAVVRQHNLRVLIVHGRQDALVPVGNSRRLAALLPRAALLELPDCGHVPQEELPQRFAAAVAEFLEAPSAGAAEA